jgi:hypothetical protein
MSTLGAVSQACVSAEAALRLGWKIMSLQRDLGVERWVATAADPTQPTDVATGHGGDPVQALLRLADPCAIGSLRATCDRDLS